jgi:hypothetical protein
VRYEVVEVVEFVPAVVPFGVVFADAGLVLVVVGDVDGEAAGFGGGVDALSALELGEEFGGGLEAGGPVRCIEVESDV